MANTEEQFFEELAKGGNSNHHYKAEVKEENSDKKFMTEKNNDSLMEVEGKLTIDVYQTPNDIVVESAIAGVNPDDIDVDVSSDSVTIRGERKHEEKIAEEDYFYQECYWGRFSRSVILPEEVDPDSATVSFKNGVLTVKLPKIKEKKTKKLKLKVE